MQPETLNGFGLFFILEGIMKTIFLTAIIFISYTLFSSQIMLLDSAELTNLSDVIVIAQVVSVDSLALDKRKPIPYDEVNIRISSFIKGEVSDKKLNLILQPRGVKGFDPQLEVGETGIFFLKDIEHGTARLTYWGSVAIFEKSHFR